MSETKDANNKEKAAKIKRKLEQDSALRRTFAAARHTSSRGEGVRALEPGATLQRRAAVTPSNEDMTVSELAGKQDYPAVDSGYDFSRVPSHAGQAKSVIQPNLAVSTPGDRYEQEADQMAAQVMSMPDNAADNPVSGLHEVGQEGIQTKSLASSITPFVQRTTPEEEMPAQAKSVQRAAPEEEDMPAQAKSMQGKKGDDEEVQGKKGDDEEVQASSASASGGFEVGGDFESRLNATRDGGSVLPDTVRSFMEPRFGADFSTVRVHTDHTAVQMNQEINAQAFTHGNNIYYGQGKSPGNNPLTAHELTHVVQQTGMHPLQKKPQDQPALLQGIAPQSQVLTFLQTMQKQPNFNPALYRKEIAEFRQTHSTEQILGKQQQLLPLHQEKISQTGDRSKIFRACGDSEAAGKITHETKFNAPDGAPKTRTNVGVGEEVKFKAPNAGKWTASDGKPTTLANGDEFNWTAPDRAASVKIGLEVEGKKSSVSMRVIEPNRITATRKSTMGFAAGKQGAGMKLTFNYHPMNVSFGNVEAKEVSGPATNVAGYFKKYSGADLWHDSGDTFFPIGQDNKDTATDTAAFWHYPKPWSKGGYQWRIPNHFKTKTEGGDGKLFTTVTQAFTITGADGTSKVEKAGASVERSP